MAAEKYREDSCENKVGKEPAEKAGRRHRPLFANIATASTTTEVTTPKKCGPSISGTQRHRSVLIQRILCYGQEAKRRTMGTLREVWENCTRVSTSGLLRLILQTDALFKELIDSRTRIKNEWSSCAWRNHQNRKTVVETLNPIPFSMQQRGLKHTIIAVYRVIHKQQLWLIAHFASSAIIWNSWGNLREPQSFAMVATFCGSHGSL